VIKVTINSMDEQKMTGNGVSPAEFWNQLHDFEKLNR
jgi:hypothetical protein